MLLTTSSDKIKNILQKLGLLIPYLRNPEVVAEYLLKYYKNKKICIYGDGLHTSELLEYLDPQYFSLSIVKQTGVDCGYISYEPSMEINTEEDLRAMDFDYLLLLGWWEEDNVTKLVRTLKIDSGKILDPYKTNEVYQNSKLQLYNKYTITATQTGKPNLFLVLTNDIKDLITISSKELSKYFNLIKIYINQKGAYESKYNIYFSQVLFLNGQIQLIDKILKTATPDVLVYWMNAQNDTWLGWHILDSIDKKTKFFLATTDFFYTKVFDMPDEELMDAFSYDTDFFEVSKQCEQELIRNSDGIITNFTGRYVENTLSGLNNNLFFSYCFYRAEDFLFLEKTIDKNNISMCYSGGISSRRDYRSHAITTFDTVFDTILNNDISVSVYSYISHNEIPPCYLALENKYDLFYWNGFVSPDKLIDELSSYDFGLLLFNLTDEVQESHKNHLQSVFQAKMINYLGAGIPVIVNEEYKLLSDFVKKEGVGISIGFLQIPRIRELIEAYDYNKLKNNVKSFQDKYKRAEHQKELADYIFASFKKQIG